MKKWEYKYTFLEFPGNKKQISDRCAEEIERLGKEGWELVSAVQAVLGISIILFWKREII